MLLRRVAPAALATAAICACEPGVGYDAGRNPQQTNYAVFDPAALPPQIPLPTDLALAQAGTTPGAQGELLRLFVGQGGFPNDQEVPISVDLVKVVVDSTGAQVRSKPDLDFGSIRVCNGSNPNCNLAVIKVASPAAPSFMTDIDTPTADNNNYVASGDHGTLNIRRIPRDVPTSPTTSVKSRTWDPGAQYIAAIRGGPNGITVNGGQPIYPQPAMFIIEQGKNLLLPENQGLIPGNSAAEKAQNAALLTQLQQFYDPPPPAPGQPPKLNAFATMSAAFPKTDIATITMFTIASVTNTAPAAHVVIDPGSGTVPLPFNALLDGSTLPDDPLAPATNARVANLTNFGPLAGGLATLDGFSTTAMLLVPVSAPVIVALGADPAPASQFTSNVFLYDLSNPNSPVLVDPSTYDDLLPGPATPFPVLRQQPPSLPGVWVSTLIGIQPAAGTKPDTAKPLKEATEYAFVVTNRIHGTDGKGIGRPTVGSVLLFNNPLWAGGKSQLVGISDGQAKALERMRVQIATLLSKLTSPPFTKSDIAVAYTFRTQTITMPALQLAAAPYGSTTSPGVNFLSAPAPFAPVILTPGAAFTKYGVSASVVQSSNILEVIEARLPTPKLLSDTTGAFDPNLLVPGASPPIDVIPALIVVPDPAKVTIPACPGSATVKCAPLVVFHHGLNGSRGQMLLGANELAGRGFVVAAIDAPKHGDRAWCTDTSQCAAGTCQPIPGAAAQGDATTPGLCKDASGNPTPLKKNPILCLTAGCVTDPARTEGTSVTSGAFLIGANLFRTRDTFRQDIIDNSGLILAMARPPTLPATTNPNPVSAELLTKGIAVDPSKVYWEGQSLGGILGTINVASNPRISEAVLNVPGGTFVDIASVSPAFKPTLNALLHNLPPPQGPIDPGTAAYTQFLQVAKWVLDPAEPINFAGRIIGDATHPTLLNLLATPVAAQAGKKVLGQMAVCDNVVPNPFNLLLFNVAGLVGGQVNGFTYFKNTSTTATNGFCVRPTPFDSGTVAHGFLLDHGLQNQGVNDAILSQDARDQAAAFLATLAAQRDNDTK